MLRNGMKPENEVNLTVKCFPLNYDVELIYGSFRQELKVSQIHFLLWRKWSFLKVADLGI